MKNCILFSGSNSPDHFSREQIERILQVAEEKQNLMVFLLIFFHMRPTIYKQSLNGESYDQSLYMLAKGNLIRTLKTLDCEPGSYHKELGQAWYGIEFLWVLMVVHSDCESLSMLLEKGVHRWRGFLNMRSEDTVNVSCDSNEHGVSDALTIKDPFFIAAALGLTDMVRLLTKYGIDSTYTDKNEVNALRIALKLGKWETAQCLFQDRQKRLYDSRIDRVRYLHLTAELAKRTAPDTGILPNEALCREDTRAVRRRLTEGSPSSSVKALVSSVSSDRKELMQDINLPPQKRTLIC